MQRTTAKLSVFSIFITVLAACALRFFQLLALTDAQTGLVAQNGKSSVVLYIMLMLCFAGTLLYCKGLELKVRTFDFENNGKAVSVGAVLLALSFFADFIHQCYNTYSYLEGASYMEYRYLIPLILSALLALVSSFYFITFSKTANGANYDFRNFTLLHFAPLAWAFTRLCMIMTRLLNAVSDVETGVEFIFLAIFISFMFSFISAVDKKECAATGVFVFTAAALCEVAFVIVLPRVLMIVSGKLNDLFIPDFTAVSYIMLGVFSLILIRDINKRNLKEN